MVLTLNETYENHVRQGHDLGVCVCVEGGGSLSCSQAIK